MDASDLVTFFNSNFFSAAFGALAGAWAATSLGRHSEYRRRRFDEIAACNVAIGQCAAVANVFVAIKRQSVKPMHDNYVQQCQLAIQAATGPAPAAPVILIFTYDLQTLTPAWVSIDALDNNIADRVLSAYEPSALLPSLTQAIYNQRHVTEARNELIKKFPTYSEDEKMARYFGVPVLDGHTDRSYPDLMQGLMIYTDDCIYFATLLSNVLTDHAARLAIELGDAAPTVKKSDFTSVQRDGLLPDPKQYAAFEAQYRPKKVDMVVTM